MRPANQACQPTPGGRLSRFRLPWARRGCTLRWAWQWRFQMRNAIVMGLGSAPSILADNE